MANMPIYKIGGILMIKDKRKWYNLGIKLSAERRFEDAQKAYLIALSIDRNYKKAWNNLGIIFFYQDRIERARDAFKEALSIDPGYAEARNNLEITYLKYNGFK